MDDGHGLSVLSRLSGAYADEIETLADQAAAALVLQETGGVLTADGTEQDVYIRNAPMSAFRPIVLLLDLDNMAGGDVIDVRIYYRMADGGAWRLLDITNYAGVDGGLAGGRKIVAPALLPARHGVLVTLQQTAGVNKTYPWQVFEEA